jgi:hypothetical protein
MGASMVITGFVTAFRALIAMQMLWGWLGRLRTVPMLRGSPMSLA